MLSRFGQLVRAFRLKANMLLSEMAEKLGKSPSYLSAVEFGRRPVPEDWPDRIADMLMLSNAERRQLTETAMDSSHKSKGAVTVSLDDLTPLQEEVAMQFARQIHALSEQDLKAIRQKLIEGRTGEQNWRGSKPTNTD
jgi:HTH-type transcriptional regulator, competence development regulator